MKQQEYNRAWAFALALIMVLTTTFGGFGFAGINGAAEQVYAADAVLGDFTVSGGTLDSDYTYAGNVLTIKTAEPISIANVSAATATVDRIVVQSGITANITLNSVNIDVSAISGACAFDMAGATVNLTLAGANILKSGETKAGLQVPSGAAVTIAGGGSLNVTGGTQTSYNSTNGGAGIGAGSGSDTGTVTINGGTIVVQGGEGAAGIGGVYFKNAGTIIINGGTVTASGWGAGIGGGGHSDAGTITIGGTANVTAFGPIYSGGSAGIGGGYFGGDGGTITIKDTATVTAKGSDDAAGIGGGSGSNGNGGTITINDSANVTAMGGLNAAGIGGGDNGAGALLTIGANAKVKASSANDNLAIESVTGSAINSYILMATYSSYRMSTKKAEIRNATGGVFDPAIEWSPTTNIYQSIAFTIPSGAADYMVYTGGQKYYQENTGTQVDQFAVTGAGLTAYTDVNLLKKPTPTATIDYANQMLMGLNASSGYYVDWDYYSSNAAGKIAIEASWYGTNIDLILCGDNVTTTYSDAQVISIPAKPTVAPTPSAILPIIINGTGGLDAVNDTMEYKLTTVSTYTAVPAAATSVNGLAVGSYHVRFKATATSFPGPTATVAITAFTGTQETTPTVFIDYINEQLTGLTANGTYTVGGTAKTADGTGKIPVDSTWIGTTKSIVKSGNGTTTTNSAGRSLVIAARPAAPAATGHNPTTIGETGSIDGLADTMEYKLSTAGSWTAVPATATSIGGLTAGTYNVRVKATAGTFAGTSKTIAITAFSATVETTPTASVDYAAEKLTGLVAGASYLVDTTEYSADGSGKLSIPASWLGGNISIVKKGDVLTTTNSNPQSVAIAARPETPTAGAFTVTQPVSSTANGTIIGITALMQYTTDSGSNWINGTGGNLSEASGTTVGIRVKATAAAPCSAIYNVALSYTPTGGGSGGGATATTVINTNTGTVTGSQIDKAVGIAKQGDTVTIQSNQTSEVTFPASGLGSLIEKDNSLTVVTENGTLTFDGKAVSSMDTQATAADIEVIVKDVERNALTQDQQTMVGDKSIYDLSVMSGGKLISNFGGGKITVSLPYELKADETAENLTVWYLADDGTLTEISCAYDAKTKSVTFVVNHFSKYVVGYDSLAAWNNPFADIKSSDWYYEAVRYVSANGMMNGQASTEFAAEAAMTRGMFVSILGRMENIDTTAYANQTTFSDVNNSQYYAPYTAWANDKGIVSGVASGKFAPDAAITREQIAVMMTNYMKYKGQGPVGAWAIQLTYADLDQVSSWSGEGVMFMTMKNVMNGMGKDANGASVFSPLCTCTRAQAATMLQRLAKMN